MAATPTPNLGLPQYDESDTAALDVLLNGITSKLDTVLGTLVQDTGWVDLVYKSGFTAAQGRPLQVRRTGGNFVTLRGCAQGAFTTVQSDVATLPVGFRPLRTTFFLGLGSSNANSGGRCYVLESGQLSMQLPTTPATTYIDTPVVSWFLD